MPPFVAHRGAPYVFPENTLAGALSAVANGSHYFEIDIQLTADHVPVLYHDGNLSRLSAADGDIVSTTLADLQRHGAFHPERFGQKYRSTPITTLQQLFSRLIGLDSQVFVELKLESLAHFGRAVVLDAVLPLVKEHSANVAAVISKDDAAIEIARERLGCDIGWVLPTWDDDHQTRATQLAPEFMFCNQHRLPANPADRWRGTGANGKNWQWVVYTVNEESVALRLLDEGIDMIETDYIGPMLKAWRA